MQRLRKRCTFCGGHRRERQTQLLLAKPLGGKRRLDGDRIDLGKERVDEGQRRDLRFGRFSEVSLQRAVAYRPDRLRPDIGKNADRTAGTERHGCGDLIVVAAPNREVVAAQQTDVCKLRQIAAGFLDSGDILM